MKIVIHEIDILMNIVEKASEHCVDLADFQFHVVLSALSPAEQPVAREFSHFGILHLGDLTESEEETLWLCNNYNPSLSYSELSAIRYAMSNKLTLLTNNRIIADAAKKHGVKVYYIEDIGKLTNHLSWFKVGRAASILV